LGTEPAHFAGDRRDVDRFMADLITYINLNSQNASPRLIQDESTPRPFLYVRRSYQTLESTHAGLGSPQPYYR
jgi:hypothetical protein